MYALLILIKFVHSQSANHIENSHSAAVFEDTEVREMYEHLFQNYNPKFRPHFLGKPVNVTVDGTILSITNPDAIKMQFTVDMYLRQRWKDPRLRHDLFHNFTIISGTGNPANMIWTPDTVFLNSVTSRLHHVTVNNHKLDIYRDGSVFWGTRVTVSAACHLDLKTYPMDTQECKVRLSSYAFNSRHIRYDWVKGKGFTLMNFSMAQFDLKGTPRTRMVLDKDYNGDEITVLEGVFKFKRQMNFAVLQIYVPCTAIVCVSWVSLWVRRSATPARITLGVTTLLTISTIWSSVNARLPRVNYVKAIDIYLMTSFVCVIFTLLEYTFVLNFSHISEKFRKMKRRKEIKKQSYYETRVCIDQLSINETSPRHVEWGEDLKSPQRKLTDKEHTKMMAKKVEFENEKVATKIELFARIFFPLIYIVFNIFYWTRYLIDDD